MKLRLIIPCLLSLGILLSSFNSADKNLVKLHTQFGDMVIYLYDATPKHRDNFLKLAQQKFFDSTTFHRVIKDFMIQGGDPNSKDNNPYNDGQGGPGYTIDAEINPMIKHKYGAVGAARENNPERKSNGSQFYIVTNKNGTAFLDGNYTVFGEVVSGMDAAMKISLTPTSGPNNRPLKDIKMSVEPIDFSNLQIK
jgi:cyclophilin family peptidyl-prolyl cis-trans isomerase